MIKYLTANQWETKCEKFGMKNDGFGYGVLISDNTEIPYVAHIRKDGNYFVVGAKFDSIVENINEVIEMLSNG